MTDNEQKEKELPDAAITALTNGRKIEAVKIVRRERGVGLREAKDAVDHYLSTMDPSQAARRAPTTDTGTGRLLWFILVVAIVITAYYMWTRA